MTTPTVIGAGPNEAGTRVSRFDAGGPVVPASIGNTAVAGPFRWGPVATGATPGGDDSVVLHGDRPSFLAWRGGDMEVDPCPTASLDFFDESEGSGSLSTLRLCDGNQAASKVFLYDRTLGYGNQYQNAYAPPVKIATVNGLYPGKRGGRGAYLAGINVSSFNASAGTFDTSIATVKDIWRGATLYFEGSTLSWKVTGNDAAGLLSIEANSSDATPASPTTKKWWLTLLNSHINAAPDGLSAWIGSSNRKPGIEFSFKLYADGEQSPRIDLSDSSGDAAKSSYLTKVLNDQQKAGQQLLSSVDFESHVPNDQARPANWVGLPLAGNLRDLSATTIKVQTWAWQVTTGTTDAYLDAGSVEDDFVNIVYGASPIRHKAVLTYDGAGAFTVQYRLWDDTVLADLTGGVSGTAFVPGVPFLAGFLVRGSSWTVADELTIWFSPLPLKLRDRVGVLWAHATNRNGTDDLRKQFRIVGNTASSVTLRSGHDLAITTVAPRTPKGDASAGPYNMAPGGLTFVYDLDGLGDVTLTSTLTGAAETTSDVATDLNAQEAIAHPGEVWVHFYAEPSTDELAWRATRSYGAAATLEYKATSTIPTGIVGDTVYTGADGDLLAVSFVQGLHGGRDGIADLGVALEYENIAWDTANSPFLQLKQTNLGLVTMMSPGNVDADAQNAAVAFVHSESLQFVGELPDGIATEEAARAWVVGNVVNAGSASSVFLWDSYGQRRSAVVPGSEDTYPTVGSYTGMCARLARDFGGYHKAPAGPAATMSRNFSRLSSVADPQRARFKQDAPLLAVGIVPIQQQGRRIFAFGDEVAMANLDGTAWLHKERVVRHLVRELLFLGKRYTYDVHDASLRSRIVVDVRRLLRPKFNAGWFHVPDGAGFDDVVAVRSDSQLNPVAVQQAGKVLAVIQLLGVVDAAKLVEFAIFPGSVAVIQE